MTSLRNLQAAILARAIFEGIPERQTARWICEADAGVLVRDNQTTFISGFDDKLALGDARVYTAS